MTPKFTLTDQTFNTQYAPLGVLFALYKQKEVLKPLEQVKIKTKIHRYSPIDKLEQVLVSILSGCNTLSEVNTKLRGDHPLAQAGAWKAMADQSTLSLALDALSQMNLTQLRHASSQILRQYGATAQHDWRGFLWLDYDLSGLICSQNAQGSEKGYFSGKKTPPDDN